MKHFHTSALLLAAVLVSCTSVHPVSESPSLRFHDGKFRIAQFTDMHWNGHSSDTLSMIENIRYVVETQKPDLIILTGDNVTGCGTQEENIREIKHLYGILDSTGIPYAAVSGNHDAEASEGCNAGLVEQWVCEYARNCINYPTTSDCFGHGNMAIPVLGENSESPAALLYVIDSNDYPQEPGMKALSYYDWIHYDQIDWYRRESDRFIALGGGSPLPALAFFHICLPEYAYVVNDPDRFGAYTEAICPAKLNTGFFAAASMQGDIMGCFVGHDHGDDFCGTYNGIALCYGRQSGAEGWAPEAPIGARIIELTEGQRSFETWCVTLKGKEPTWYYPSGFNSAIADNPLPAVKGEGLEHGVNYRYYEGPETALSTVAMNTPTHLKRLGTAAHFDISKAAAEDHFGFEFSAWLDVPETGAYRFRLSSDDGAVMKIDGQLFIDQDGDHGSTSLRFAGLEKGLHKIEISYFENYGGQSLSLSYRTLDSDWKQVPESELYRTIK